MKATQVYVHLDTISNSVMSKGMSLVDFQEAITLFPQNILLLSAEPSAGEFEPSTGLRMIRGEEAIRQFFNSSLDNGNSMKWIDFKSIDLLRQLTPIEISELLYFAHMRTHLHSPFFYKLQNNFVFFGRQDDYGKVYYRHLDEFFLVLQRGIERQVQEQVNHRRLFFQQKVAIPTVDLKLLKEAKSILQEGVVFDFSQKEMIDDLYCVPVYIMEDKIKTATERDEKILTLIYSHLDRTWTIEYEDVGLLYGSKQV
ncbi:hypothetical protein ACWN8V_04210 [Vagococcus elongatus]|uniref:Uncharacterized protein n=1 Tax=Vagococcus elongatus TaxID=180344 RepID=A0A430AYG9_9ENTE|nr:hypothetical protein [Vagococcus elongatus]RSU13088.1 hypothetical protein CBF29_05310 [Vagococcus elongatus]